VLHLDTGWFEKDWHCDWKFSAKNFPEPAGFLRRMVKKGFKVSLWQIPYVRPEIDLAETALEHGYVGNETEHSKRFWLGYTLDFTRPETTRWYQSLLAPLLEMGVAAIKTDFGEEIDEGAIYAGMSGAKYHNLFSLLYQKAAWEITEQVHGKGNAVIWARSGWAGSQRYPVHWGGDAAATYDGLAGTLCGGLHLGLSGFAFWSHDVGGIHGIPDFENSRPSEDLYVRWTQVGVFSSHIRYHGGTPREPWEFPAVADIVRQWLRFRYSLLPYILEQARISIRSGLPMLRSLIFDWPDDPAAWTISDQYLFGESLLICPVLNASGTRDVYLPEGRWVDFWNGALLSGPLHLKGLASPLSRLPIYVRYKSGITFAEPVQHTGLLPQASKILIQFDEGYPGFESCPLGDWLRFDPD
jgi:alpha-D-xyloside xylohydrolase